jgi:hypothetical protein
VKTFDDSGGAWLILVTIKHELAFLLGLCHIGIRHEVEYLGWGLRLSLRQNAGRRKSNEWYRSDRASNFQQRASSHVSIFDTGHLCLPVVRFFFVSPHLFSLACDNRSYCARERLALPKAPTLTSAALMTAIYVGSASADDALRRKGKSASPAGTNISFEKNRPISLLRRRSVRRPRQT